MKPGKRESGKAGKRESGKAGRREGGARFPALQLSCFLIRGLLGVGLLAAFPAEAADITPGYTFVANEKNVDHTKLNNLGAGSINTSFFSGKSSAGANPTAAWEVLLRDTTSDLFKRTTISAGFLDHTGLLSARTAKTAPVAADQILLSDSADSDAYKRMYVSNLLFGAAFYSGITTNEDLIPFYDASAGTMHRATLSNLFGNLTAVTTLTPFENGAEELHVMTQGRGLAKLTLANLIFGAGNATPNPTGNDFIAIAPFAGSGYSKVQLSSVHWGGTPSTGPLASHLFGFAVASNGVAAALSHIRYDLLKSNINFGPGYIRAREEQTSGTEGGTFTTGAWQVRTLNTLATQNVNGVSLAGDLVTLPAGYYLFRAVAPGLAVAQHQLMLTNSTDGTVVELGPLTRSTASVSTYAEVSGRFTNASAKAYGLRHRCANTQATTGFGQAGGWGTEVYAQVEFWKE